MARLVITERPADLGRKDLVSDPDSCPDAFSPSPGMRMKMRQGALVFEVRGMWVPGGTILDAELLRIGLDLPGLAAAWSISKDSNSVTMENLILGIRCIFRANLRGQCGWALRFASRPAVDSIRIPVSLPNGVSVSVGNGRLRFTKNGLPVMVLAELRARDAGSVSRGMTWRVTAGEVFIDLTAADWDAATYPVTVA